MRTRHRIILATYGTLGDLHPYLAIARELRGRGHRPVIATSEFHRRIIEAAGVEFRPIRPDISFDDLTLHRRLTEPRRGLERVIREVMLPALRSTYDDLLAVVEDGGADLLISQILVFAAPLVAEMTHVPWVSTELQPGAFMSVYDPPVLAPFPSLARLRPLGPRFHRALFRSARLLARSWGEPVHHLRKDLGLPAGGDPLFEGRNSGRLVLALFSEVMGAPQPDWPPNTIVTGFPFHDEPDFELPSALSAFLAGGEPPITFTFGSSAAWDAASFYRDSLEAVEILGRRAVLLVGGNPNNQPCAPLPEKVMVASYVPYAQLFPRSAAIVHHGGIGTTGQALRAGRPMLITPVGGDQFDNAARAVRLGVARTIPHRRYTARRAAEELSRLLEDRRCADQAAAVGKRIRCEDGVRATADVIEQQLQQTA